jgi:hypothetical protein
MKAPYQIDFAFHILITGSMQPNKKQEKEKLSPPSSASFFTGQKPLTGR